MTRYIIRRLLQAIPLLLLITFILFMLPSLWAILWLPTVAGTACALKIGPG